MKKILFLTTSPVAGGNGDALTEAAMKAAEGRMWFWNGSM